MGPITFIQTVRCWHNLFLTNSHYFCHGSEAKVVKSWVSVSRLQHETNESFISRISSEMPVIWMFSHAEASTYVHQYCLPHTDLRFDLFNDVFCSLYYRMISYMNCTPYLKKNNEMFGAYGKYGEERCVQVIGGEIWGTATSWKT